MPNNIRETFKQEGIYDKVDAICEKLAKRYEEDDFISADQYDYLNDRLSELKSNHTPFVFMRIAGEITGAAEAVFRWRYWSESLYGLIIGLGDLVFEIAQGYVIKDMNEVTL